MRRHRRGLAALSLALGTLAGYAVAQSRNPKDLSVGKLLVASAKAPDGRFQHAVVLLVNYSAKGAVGLILNHPAAPSLAQVFAGLASARGRTDHTYWGGPVEPKQVFCLLRLDASLREAQRILPQVYFSTSRDLMQLALNAQQPASSFRVYQGFAGWSPDKLHQELAAGLWTIHPATAATIFAADPATLWSSLQAAVKSEQ